MEISLDIITAKIEGKVLTTSLDIQNITISDGYVSDLLSDVMANAREDQVWITIMKHLNAVAVASLANIPCIIFANGVIPDKEVITKAGQEKICLISSKLSSFQIAGILYMLLVGNPDGE